MAESAEVAQPVVGIWQFVETNEWEGERWTSFFEVTDPEVQAALEELRPMVNSEDMSSYKLLPIDRMPAEDELDDGMPTECDFDMEDGESCGDCGYCCGYEPYFPPESIYGPPNLYRVRKAVDFWSDPKEAESRRLSDPLYKFGLYDDEPKPQFVNGRYTY